MWKPSSKEDDLEASISTLGEQIATMGELLRVASHGNRNAGVVGRMVKVLVVITALILVVLVVLLLK